MGAQRHAVVHAEGLAGSCRRMAVKSVTGIRENIGAGQRNSHGRMMGMVRLLDWTLGDVGFFWCVKQIGLGDRKWLELANMLTMSVRANAQAAC
jgi:hypothetical protein